jgi:hypothetical protein
VIFHEFVYSFVNGYVLIHIGHLSLSGKDPIPNEYDLHFHLLLSNFL